MDGHEVIRALYRAGFAFDRQSSSHVILWHPERARGVSVPVHGSKDLKPGVLRRILRDAGLTVEEVRALLG